MTAPNGNGTARWQLWVSIATAGLAVFGSIMVLYWTSMTAYNNTQTLDKRLETVENIARQNRTDLSVMRADIREVETQFRASDQVRNIFHANDLRVQSMLWKKAFGQDYPTDNAYYPTIARDPAQEAR